MKSRSDKNKRGIALILMLGILALMAMLALTFSGTMRMERSASGNFREAAQTRETLYASLTRAMEALDSEIGTNGYPDWADDVYVSGGGGSLSLLKGEATNFVPGVLWDAAIGNKPNWVDLDQGRGAFIILNCSGLLDANYVGGETNRLYGTNVNEVVIDDLNEMANAAAFYGDRTTNGHYRYETLWDLNNVQSGNLSDWPQSLFHYSRAPIGYLDQSGMPRTNVVEIGKSVSNLVADSARITTGLIDAGIDVTDVAFVFDNLLDYVDADSVPQDVGSGTTEPVPMINEIRVELRMLNASLVVGVPPGSGANNQVVTELLVDFELFYPFVKASADNFSLSYRIEVQPAGTNQDEIDESARWQPAGGTGSVANIYSGQATWYDKVVATTRSYPIIGVDRAVQYPMQYDITIWAAVSNGIDLVDAMPFPATADGLMVRTPAILLPTSTVEWVASPFITTTNGAEALDPRFNWDPTPVTDTVRWTGGEIAHWWPYDIAGGGVGYPGSIFDGDATPSNGNQIALTYMAGSVDDGHMDMHVANHTLRQAGELGYLLRTRLDRWSTVRFFPQYGNSGNPTPVDRILDHFVANPRDRIHRGLVNPNTKQDSVLSAVFQEMPLNEYPGQVANLLTPAQATTLANSFISARGSRRMMNLSELGLLGTNVALSVLPNATPFQREAVLRNSSEMFSTRQNVFTILLSAESIARAQDEKVWVERDAAARYGIPGGWLTTVEADQRAVAIVWRDPYPDPSHGNRHAYLVQELKLLSR